MAQVSGLRFQIDQTHAQLLARAQEKLGAQTAQSTNGPAFTERLNQGLQDVAKAQSEASTLARNYDLGLENDLAKVMVSQQVSSLGFQLTLSLRNKALSAYKDIMNMPV